MATIKEIKELALHAAKGTAPTNFTVNTVNEALRAELNGLAGSINDFNRNKYDIFDIIIETADEIVPKKVLATIGQFAEVQTVAQGQKAIFKTKGLGKMRARKFLTQVGLSGVYETFRLDSKTIELKAHAVGGGATVDFERMLDGVESMADVMEVITEGLVDAVYVEVIKEMQSAYSKMAATNKNTVTTNAFDADEMVKLTRVAKQYGGSAVIVATEAFVDSMGADVIVSAGSGVPGVSVDDIESIHNTGLIHIFRGTPIIILPNTYVDEKNEKVWFSDQYAYILPTGAEKIVKVVLEGQTQIHSFENRDNSMEVYAYKKMGAAILHYNNWCVYKNTSLADNSDAVYGF